MKPLPDTVRPGRRIRSREASRRPSLGAYRDPIIESAKASERPLSLSPISEQPMSGAQSVRPTVQPQSGVKAIGRHNVLAQVSGRAIGLIEGAALRIKDKDPELAEELEASAKELWAMLKQGR